MSILELHHVTKSFGGVHAVRGCSFSIAAERVTALIGPNGAGKTTLFNLIGGFLPADAGTIQFAGRDVSACSAWQRSRAGLARTFQLPRLFRNLSLRDNLLLSVRQDDHHFWHSILQRSNDHEHDALIRERMAFIGLSKSLDTIVTDMSYGEQKLLDLVRAVLNPHTLLMLDEPVAGVNPVIREQLKGVFQKFKAAQETVLLIEHDMDFVRSVADWVIVMDQGAVLAQGEPQDVLLRREVLEAYLGSSQ